MGYFIGGELGIIVCGNILKLGGLGACSHRKFMTSETASETTCKIVFIRQKLQVLL